MTKAMLKNVRRSKDGQSYLVTFVTDEPDPWTLRVRIDGKIPERDIVGEARTQLPGLANGLDLGG